MALSELPLEEREERARLIDYMLEFSPLRLPGSYIKDLQSVSQEDFEELYSALERPRTFVSFFKAAHLVRNNYDEWKNFLEDPTQPLPPVFLGFSENKLLFLHLFLLESMKIFNLDPHHPFFVCMNVDNTNFITLCEENDDSRRITSIEFSRKLVNMWNSFGCPEKETTDVGLMLTLLEESLERSNESEMLNGSFSLNVVLCVSLNGSILSSVIRQIGGGRLRLHMPHLVGMITLAIAFDDPEADTLEIFCELFPQFPELVSRVTSSYYLAISDPICPSRMAILSVGKNTSETYT